MGTKETNRDRQNNELEVIKSIYGADVDDMRDIAQGWKPLDLRILLTPLQGSSGDQKVHVWTKLRVTCSNKYPKTVPKIALEGTKGISDASIEELLRNLQKQAASLKGEVMIYDLAQTVQFFLLKHNKPTLDNGLDVKVENITGDRVVRSCHEALREVLSSPCAKPRENRGVTAVAGPPRLRFLQSYYI